MTDGRFEFSRKQFNDMSVFMKNPFSIFVWLVSFACLQTSLFAQRGGEVIIQPNKIKENLYMLVGQGGNIGFLSNNDGVLLVDTQFQRLAPKIIKTVGELSQGKIQYVLNTHHHGDHTGGNAAMGIKSTIVAHDNVRKRLSAGGKSGASLPKLTYSKRMVMHFGDEEIQLIHLGPGHTDTDSVVFFKSSNVIHMGDLFFNKRYPFIDLSSGGSVQGYLSNIKIVAGMVDAETKIIPGHGELATQADLILFIDMFDECFSLVSKARKNGKSLEEIKKAGLPKKYESWGQAFINEDRWIGFLFAGAQ